MTLRNEFCLMVALTMGVAAVDSGRAQEALAAAQDFDGTYAVYITTRQGDCDKSYLWTISVSGGRVSSTGETAMEASGRVHAGKVDLAFERLGQVARATGKLTKGVGSGTWTSPTMGCNGYWRAKRQG
ncbi:MAG TPA: hypothetical protein VEK34_17115 [Methylocella sp.]|nr:hypothetical protein [Methylocella sp.]